jgi:hypothetical protein
MLDLNTLSGSLCAAIHENSEDSLDCAALLATRNGTDREIDGRSDGFQTEVFRESHWQIEFSAGSFIPQLILMSKGCGDHTERNECECFCLDRNRLSFNSDFQVESISHCEMETLSTAEL